MQVCDYSLCTGCGVCADICPNKCIKIEYNNDGFLQSCVDNDNCINCNKCKKVCPALNPNIKNIVSTSYKVKRNDNVSIVSSTSGGVATLLSEYIINNGGVVVGCGFDENLVLKHSIAKNPSELEKFKGSKYVQSNTVGIYSETKRILNTGRMVLFVGTPCQISALHSFLGNPYDNLFTVDFVCHGVSSQKILDKYVLEIEKIVNNKIISVKFRNKDDGYKNCSKNEWQFLYDDGVYSVAHDKGIVLWFSSSLSVRESCYNCNFVNVKRSSDITLADYNGEDISEQETRFGVSTVFLNSEKGTKLFDKIKDKAEAEQKDLNICINNSWHLNKHSQRPKIRNKFFADLNKLDIVVLIKKYTLKKILPSKIFLYVSAIKRKFQKKR